jgi:MerR family transcriptional regulator/heat shock protein HspR
MMEYNRMGSEETIFPIRTAAKLLGISIHTLRMYEREGLIIPFKTSGNQRLYSYNDIERIVSIRKNIKESKISINGLRAITSMVPCFRIINCSQDDRKNCEAYHEGIKPCWTYKHKNNICENIDCRECDVYKNNYDFISTKNTLKILL